MKVRALTLAAQTAGMMNGIATQNTLPTTVAGLSLQVCEGTFATSLTLGSLAEFVRLVCNQDARTFTIQSASS